MSRHNAPEIFFPQYGAAHGHVQEPTPGSAVEFWGQSVRKNRPLVPRSNIAGSWTRGVREHRVTKESRNDLFPMVCLNTLHSARTVHPRCK